jgi:hypothetical protein
MAASQPTAPDAPGRRRRTITTLLVMMLVIMVVIDIFARRWTATT